MPCVFIRRSNSPAPSISTSNATPQNIALTAGHKAELPLEYPDDAAASLAHNEHVIYSAPFEEDSLLASPSSSAVTTSAAHEETAQAAHPGAAMSIEFQEQELHTTDPREEISIQDEESEQVVETKISPKGAEVFVEERATAPKEPAQTPQDEFESTSEGIQEVVIDETDMTKCDEEVENMSQSSTVTDPNEPNDTIKQLEGAKPDGTGAKELREKDEQILEMSNCFAGDDTFDAVKNEGDAELQAPSLDGIDSQHSNPIFPPRLGDTTASQQPAGHEANSMKAVLEDQVGSHDEPEIITHADPPAEPTSSVQQRQIESLVDKDWMARIYSNAKGGWDDDEEDEEDHQPPLCAENAFSTAQDPTASEVCAGENAEVCDSEDANASSVGVTSSNEVEDPAILIKGPIVAPSEAKVTREETTADHTQDEDASHFKSASHHPAHSDVLMLNTTSEGEEYVGTNEQAEPNVLSITHGQDDLEDFADSRTKLSDVADPSGDEEIEAHAEISEIVVSDHDQLGCPVPEDNAQADDEAAVTQSKDEATQLPGNGEPQARPSSEEGMNTSHCLQHPDKDVEDFQKDTDSGAEESTGLNKAAFDPTSMDCVLSPSLKSYIWKEFAEAMSQKKSPEGHQSPPTPPTTPPPQGHQVTKADPKIGQEEENKDQHPKLLTPPDSSSAPHSSHFEAASLADVSKRQIRMPASRKIGIKTAGPSCPEPPLTMHEVDTAFHETSSVVPHPVFAANAPSGYAMIPDPSTASEALTQTPESPDTAQQAPKKSVKQEQKKAKEQLKAQAWDKEVRDLTRSLQPFFFEKAWAKDVPDIPTSLKPVFSQHTNLLARFSELNEEENVRFAEVEQINEVVKTELLAREKAAKESAKAQKQAAKKIRQKEEKKVARAAPKAEKKGVEKSKGGQKAKKPPGMMIG